MPNLPLDDALRGAMEVDPTKALKPKKRKAANAKKIKRKKKGQSER